MKFKVRFCLTHESLAFRPEDDPDDFWLCESSNLSGDRRPCEVVDGEVTV